MLFFLKNREINKKELMDNPDCNKKLLFNTYREFHKINKLFSGWHYVYHKLIIPQIQDKSRTYSILDVGYGIGDVLGIIKG